ncbi:putative disease resistance rpp8-like protein 4 [Quercus suber]|uniref:Disease resistance rpp8-like protein 4 n=1 Tax=Quercus suber TaxID=58331 RepID=A0AAW0KLG1_QUESU
MLELDNLRYLQTLLNVMPETIKMATSFQLDYLRILGINNGGPNLILMATKTSKNSPILSKLELKLTNLEEDPMPTLEKLPNLKILCFLYYSFNEKDMVCFEGGFPLLQSLLLSSLGFLKEWRVEEGAMPSLCHLTIHMCCNLKSIPNELRFVTTLLELDIKWMPKLDEGGLDFDKVKHVPSLVIRF